MEGVERLRQTGHLFADGKILHRNMPFETRLPHRLVYVGIVNLSGTRFVTPWVVSNVKRRYPRRRFDESANGIPGLHLLVIDIEQELNVRMVHLPDQPEPFDTAIQEKSAKPQKK